jgi:glycerophosphoryl diester phosphodiesterase
MSRRLAAFITMVTMASLMVPAQAIADDNDRHGRKKSQSVQLGPRPYFLVDDMDEGPLKKSLQKCSEGPFEKTDFSIGHRGACLQFPEHTKESYEAAARMGAGILECDVTFTEDLLARKVGVIGIFSDWAGTVTYYASCMHGR